MNTEEIQTRLDAGLNVIEKWVRALEPAENQAQREAVKKFGNAIDAIRNTGISADFVDPLSEQLQAMTENLLTDQRTAAE